jgi:predicted small secreted protein
MRRNLAIAFISLIVLTGASTFLSACNTVEGAGRDVSSAGQAITEEAKKDKK